MTPLTSRAALDSFYLEARCKVLDLAAILDRIDRGQSAGDTHDDSRLLRVRQALQVLLDHSPARTERVQQVFSLDYDATWERPVPRF
jgi:hypothetical protein